MKQLEQDYYCESLGLWFVGGKCYAEDPRKWWHDTMPKELWTDEAFQLFQAAEREELLFCDADEDSYPYKPGRKMKSKGQLALWCKLASTYLEMDSSRKTAQGALQTLTNWKPFEKVFNSGSVDWMARAGKRTKVTAYPTPLKVSYQQIEEADASDLRIKPIYDFFAEFEKGRNPSNCDLNNRDEDQ